MKSNALKSKLKERIALGLNHGLKSVEEVLKPESPLYNELITYKSQYNDLNRIASQNLIRYEQIEIGLNKIRSGLLGLIDRIEEQEFKGGNAPLPQLKNNELQFRKNNFFELLEIHYKNLENINIVMTTYGEDDKDTVRTGRDAIHFIYNDFFKYGFNNPRHNEKELVENIRTYSRHFYIKGFHRMEVYMKTIKFILTYILEEEMEQGFFLDVFKSILSSYEQVSIFYYALSDIDPEFDEVLKKADLFSPSLIDLLVKKEHLEEYEKQS